MGLLEGRMPVIPYSWLRVESALKSATGFLMALMHDI